MGLTLYDIFVVGTIWDKKGRGVFPSIGPPAGAGPPPPKSEQIWGLTRGPFRAKNEPK